MFSFPELQVTARGKSNRAFSWSRTYGREFADPASGIQTLKELSRMTGGCFQATPEEVFAKGKATARLPVRDARSAAFTVLGLRRSMFEVRCSKFEVLFSAGPAARATATDRKRDRWHTSPIPFPMSPDRVQGEYRGHPKCAICPLRLRGRQGRPSDELASERNPAKFRIPGPHVRPV